DRPTHRTAKRVGDCTGGRHRHVRPGRRVDAVTEEHHVSRDERARGDGPCVDHHELAPGGHQGGSEHQQKDGIDAVVADEGGERGEQHHRVYFWSETEKRGTRRTVNVAPSVTEPSSFVAVSSTR